MEKVKVSREVAEAIESLRMSTVWTDENILLHHIQKRWQVGGYQCLNQLNIETLAKILIIGYEVEKTPAEELAKLYNEKVENQNVDGFKSWYDTGFKDGIINTLNILNIKVKGIDC